jgi:hypothetical protein
MTAITITTVTAAQVAAGLTDDWCYSDAFKSIYGYRPRGEYINSPEYVARFWNEFDVLCAEAEAQDREDLAAACEAAGIPVTNWTAYYDWLEAKDRADEAAFYAEQAEIAAEKAEYFRRGTPTHAVEAWAHGADFK